MAIELLDIAPIGQRDSSANTSHGTVPMLHQVKVAPGKKAGPQALLACRRGYTLVEATSVIVIFSILTGAMLPRVSPTVTRVSVTRGANVIAQDLEHGFTLASRQQQPVVLTAVPSQRGYTLTDRGTGTVLSSRSFAPGNGLAVDSVQMTPSTIQIFPTGFASGPVTVTLWSRGASRTVTASRTGIVNIP